MAELPDGAIAVLENTRRYSLEQTLWTADQDAIAEMAPRLTNYVNSVAHSLARIHVNEALGASNRDLSSTLVPLSCQKVALGQYVGQELTRHVTRTRQADLVVFSGIKINKLDDLEQIIATRAKASPDDSWTAKLLAKGPEKVAEKFGEEAIEAIIGPKRERREQFDTPEGEEKIIEIIKAGTKRANAVAEETLYEAKKAMKIDFGARSLAL